MNSEFLEVVQIPNGSWAIKLKGQNKYFFWSYKNKRTAEVILSKIKSITVNVCWNEPPDIISEYLEE